MIDEREEQINLATLRARLATSDSTRFWRSLDELADTPVFEDWLRHEFPRYADLLPAAFDRRSFLKLMGGSLALAGLSACAPQPAEKIVPYVDAPTQITPGAPAFFATALAPRGYATGVLVESHEGRPTKIEGNPAHPASLGATDIFTQASLLSMYDPERSQAVLRRGQISTWDSFLSNLTQQLETQHGVGGAGLRVLTETVTSPTLAAQLEALLAAFLQAKWHQYEPLGRDNAQAGAQLAFGSVVNPVYRFDQATVILSLDADFLFDMPGNVRYAREFIDGRRVRTGQTTMNRLYVVEPTPTLTGAMADHRLPLRASLVEDFAREIAQQIGVPCVMLLQTDLVPTDWLSELVNDLKQHRGASLVLAGENQPPAVHALAHAMNDALGNVGRTVVYTAPVEARPIDQLASLRDLVADLDAGKVDLLVIIGGNPVYTAPADFDFTTRLAKARQSVHMSQYVDETSNLSQWHIPLVHELESWSDGRAFDGTAAIIQPLIAPLYGGKSTHELLSALLGQPGQASYDNVRAYWQSQHTGTDFEAFWNAALNKGVIDGTALPPVSVTLQSEATRDTRSALSQGLEIVFRADPSVWDGRFANNGWLQELPRPLSSLTWDNVALVSLATAQRLDVTNEDVVELTYAGRTVRAPIWVAPGHANESVTLHLGYGRQAGGTVAAGAGFNAYALRTAATPWFGTGLELRKTGEHYALASTQSHYAMEGRDLVRVAPIADFTRDPTLGHGAEDVKPPSLYPDYQYTGNAWGMSIDLNACIGCNACTIACQAENNIPVVGKTEVARGREMHWIRVDQYFSGGLDNPQTYHQPVPCMHCENAPCELVCPVQATVHDAEGLNNMVYNRCIGTRYCSNNCPYKVRRFNFFQYAKKNVPVLELMANPNVTVRDRGVMEKCSYCVQRISAARITAKEQDRPIRDGEVVTACQQVCPTEAIVFGNLNDPASQVAKLKAEPQNYGLLTDLNTRPRTTYLPRLRNPNGDVTG